MEDKSTTNNYTDLKYMVINLITKLFYKAGFGNHFETEAEAGALPKG